MNSEDLKNIKDYKDGNFSKLLDHDYKNDKLEFELMRAINKILILRKKKFIYLKVIIIYLE